MFALWAIIHRAVSARSALRVCTCSQMTLCECQKNKRQLALVDDAIEAVHEAMRLLPEDEQLREEERLLRDLQARIVRSIAALAA